MKKYSQRHIISRGFTLIELMIVVVIIGVLAAIAVPSFDSYLVRARRNEAKAIVERGALWMERNQSTAFSYAKDSAGVALTANSLKAQGLGQSPEGAASTVWYIITLNAINVASFEIIATAQGTQATKDSKCAVLVRDNLGRRGTKIAGTLDYTSVQARDCWAG